MKNKNIRAWFLLAVLSLFPLATKAGDDVAFSKERPLVYEDDWDLWPYVFLNERGEPDGYNVELVKMILEELDIPYVIRLRPSQESLNDLLNGHSDLMLGMKADYHDEYGIYGQVPLMLFTHSVVCPKSQPVTLKKTSDLAREHVIVHEGSFSHHLMDRKGWGANAEPYEDMKDAILRISADNSGQILWNTMSLKWLMRKYQTDNLQISPVDMPHGEYKFMSNNQQLLHKLDSVYMRLQANEQLTDIQNKWFYPEYNDTGIPSWIWLFIGALGVIGFILAFYNIFYRIQERRLNSLVEKRNTRLSLILKTSHVHIFTYDIGRQIFSLIEDDIVKKRQYSMIEFAQFFLMEDFEQICNGLNRLASNKCSELRFDVMASYNGEMRDYVLQLSVLRTQDNMPSVIMGISIDATNEHLRLKRTKEMMIRYQTIYTTAMVDMVYFDKDGKLANLNEKASKTFGITHEDLPNSNIVLFDLIQMTREQFIENEFFFATLFMEDRYYELKLVPIFDAAHNLMGIYGTGRDVTEIADSYHHEQLSIDTLKKSNQEIDEYITNINYALQSGGVRMVNYDPHCHLLTIFRGINEVQHVLTQSRCMALADESLKRKVVHTLTLMDKHSEHVIEADFKTVVRMRNGNYLHLHFHFIPTFDKDGQLESYFGMCRDVSEMKATEEQLSKETQKAREMESIKDIFLKNMSYEIRTPLNAVVGFADLFDVTQSPKDQNLFVEEIKKNSKRLLNLINDILFLSRLDANMIEIKRAPADFSAVFAEYCELGWQNLKKEGVKLMVDSVYQQLIVDIDSNYVGLVVQNLASNAAQYTEQGSVLARYDYVGDKLVFSFEDTGCGISEKDLPRIFERFVSSQSSGTGLGLPICKMLVEQMGGTININSEYGKGTTVWVTIPCHASVVERQKVTIEL